MKSLSSKTLVEIGKDVRDGELKALVQELEKKAYGRVRQIDALHYAIRQALEHVKKENTK